ncbi:site-2 protease family protein [Collinsella sp. zg1085]|uniref:site-2 protease family protein n=1 Tax=Collinsella sp. zg1085 TaxID=2844380 RepID=UPI001C0B5C48|nr:site-2 protease family protein [Collinsella sp. zg1085]QWT17026.1 site-2 protease family protein [Collinsella sp. zg1085]
MNILPEGLPLLLIQVLVLIISITVHESAHALVAYMLGDETARSRGRISLNPLNHIDYFGTIILPGLMLMTGGPVFAFAKPVPVYLGNLKHPKRDEVLVSLAGPVSNLVLAGIATLALRILVQQGFIGSLIVQQLSPNMLYLLCTYGITINLTLAFFNLIPIPPLDGSSVLVFFLRGKALLAYYRMQQYAMPILLGILYILPELLHIDLLQLYFGATVYPLTDMLFTIALGL